jgi:[ribosomal protein S5]-alanine N-acetyltransferase
MSFIETQRLVIRKWQLPRDLDDAFALYGDPQTMHFIPCGALTREQTERLVLRMIEKDEQQGYGIWPVVHKEEHRVIGECGITQIPEHEPDVEIAWIYNKNYHRHGYAAEAARAVIDFAFDELHIGRLYALIDRFNAPSIALANRLHMRYDRIIRAYKRDLMRYEKASP